MSFCGIISFEEVIKRYQMRTRSFIISSLYLLWLFLVLLINDADIRVSLLLLCLLRLLLSHRFCLQLQAFVILCDLVDQYVYFVSYLLLVL